MSTTKKILFSGNTTRQNLIELLRRVQRVHEKAGPFEALFVFGSLLCKTSNANEEEEDDVDVDDEDEAADWKNVKSDDKKAKEMELHETLFAKENRGLFEEVNLFFVCTESDLVRMKELLMNAVEFEDVSFDDDGEAVVVVGDFRRTGNDLNTNVVEGLNPVKSIKRIKGEEHLRKVFFITKPGVYSNLLKSVSSDDDEEEGVNKTKRKFSIAVLPGEYDFLNAKDSKSLLAEKTARANGEFTVSDVEVIRAACRGLKEQQSELQVVDVFLSNAWPKDVHMLSRYKEKMGLISGDENLASRDVADLANSICPRYHVVPSYSGGDFFEREPYRNVSAKYATRFISLAEVANEAKHKWIHALGMEPGGRMNPIKLCQMPPDSTPSPYAMAGVSNLSSNYRNNNINKRELKPDWRDNAGEAKKQKLLEENQTRALIGDADKTIHVRNLDYRADEGAIAEYFGECGELADIRLGRDIETGRSRGFCKISYKTKEGVDAALERDQQNFYGREIRVAMDKQQLQSKQYNGEGSNYDSNNKRPPPPPLSCWFCVSNGKDTHMIASIGNSSFVSMDKGGLNPEHAQIVPIEHVAAFSMLPDETCDEVWSYLTGLRKYAASTEERGIVAFERHLTLKNKGGNHMHLNVVPIPKNRTHLSKKIFDQAAKRCDFSWDVIAPEQAQTGIAARTAITSLLSFPEAEYYAVHLPDGTILLSEVKQYDKHWMQFGREVISHLLKTPETANWQSVVQDEDGEIERTNAFKESFKVFDPVMQVE